MPQNIPNPPASTKFRIDLITVRKKFSDLKCHVRVAVPVCGGLLRILAGPFVRKKNAKTVYKWTDTCLDKVYGSIRKVTRLDPRIPPLISVQQVEMLYYWPKVNENSCLPGFCLQFPA